MYQIDKGKVGSSLRYLDKFQKGTSFDGVLRFYLMDKTLRVLLCDALERIEVHLRTIIAHELGRHDPLAHLTNSYFRKKAFSAAEAACEKGPTLHEAWLARHAKLIEQSHEESIRSHLKAKKPIPIWVASEAWDFGSMGFPDGGFPRANFPITIKPVVAPRTLDEVCASAVVSLTQATQAISSFPPGVAASHAKQKFADDMLNLIAGI